MKIHTRRLVDILGITVIVALVVLANRPVSGPFKTLTNLGALIEIKSDSGYYVQLPDMIDPDVAIANLKQIPNTSRIHFVPGLSPPAGTIGDTWEWIDNELTITTIPGAGHFVQQDAPEKVSRAMLSWLNR